jgi:hypothetical protein
LSGFRSLRDPRNIQEFRFVSAAVGKRRPYSTNSIEGPALAAAPLANDF